MEMKTKTGEEESKAEMRREAYRDGAQDEGGKCSHFFFERDIQLGRSS